MTYTFDKQSVTRISTVVKRVENSPLMGPSHRRRGRRGKAGGEAISTAFPAIIKTGSQGVYTVDITDADGNIIEEDQTAITTKATNYDIPADYHVTALKINTQTLG
jgi:hypothetical protein